MGTEPATFGLPVQRPTSAPHEAHMILVGLQRQNQDWLYRSEIVSFPQNFLCSLVMLCFVWHSFCKCFVVAFKFTGFRYQKECGILFYTDKRFIYYTNKSTDPTYSISG